MYYKGDTRPTGGHHATLVKRSERKTKTIQSATKENILLFLAKLEIITGM